MALCEPLTPTHRQPEKSSENYSVQHYHDFEIHGGSFNSKILKESTMAFRRSESSVLLGIYLMESQPTQSTTPMNSTILISAIFTSGRQI